MPTYDYSCRSCGARFEVWQKMTDEPLSTCPTCGGEVHRIVYPVGLVFKGSGFYSTDNRRSGGAKDSGTEAPSPPPAKAPSEQTTEKKAEPAPAKAAASE